MLSHIVSDLYEAYVEEILTPQLGKKTEKPSEAPKASGGSDSSGASSEKRIRQAVYDIRYRARREEIELGQAFNQYMSHTSMNAVEKKAVKEKLGLISGSGSSPAVKEEYVDEAIQSKKFKVRVTDKNSGKSYVRMATREKINSLRSNPNISSVEMTSYGTPYEGEKSKGKATASVTSGKGLSKKDYDGDGKVESGAKEYRGAVHNAIQRKKGLKPDGKDTSNVKEGFSNWRTELSEVVSDDIASEKKSQIKEKSVNNYAGKNKCVEINPKLSESIQNLGGQLIESVELSEEYIAESVNIAAQYFCEQGLNEVGVDILIEELGLDDFVSFIFEINDETISEARAGGVKVEPVTATGKPFKSGKPTKKGLERLQKLKAERKEREEKASSEKPSGMKSSLQRQSAIANAKKQQPKKKGLLDRVAGAINKGIERHNAAMSAAKETGKTIRKAAGKVGGVAKEVGKGASGAAKLAGHVASKGLKEETEFDEEYKDLPTGRMVKQASKHGQRGGMAHLKQRQVEKTPKGLRTLTGSRERASELEGVKKSSYKKAATMTAVASTHDAEKSQAKSSLNRAKGTKSNIRAFSREEYEVNEAVYGGEKKEPKDTRMTVTASDKKANTKAWQNYQAGHKGYKAADHLNAGYEPEGSSLDEKITAKTDIGMAIKDFQSSKSPQLAGRTKEERRKAAIAAVLTARRGGEKLKEQSVDSSSTLSAQQINSRRNLIAAQRKVSDADKNALQKKSDTNITSDNKTTLKQSFEYDSNSNNIDELNRAERETGINTKTGRPTQKGGAKDDKAFTSVKRMIRGMEGTPAGQRKKEPGKKPPTAGQYGGPKSPAQKVAARRASAQRSQDLMHSPRD
jgi:hypothetical protein